MCAALDKGTIIADKLEVIRLLGAGGMGAVYEVEHLFTKHRRALKMLHSDFSRSQEVVQRFLREASAAGRIGSPHIVETHDAGHLPTGEPYLVMDLLKGKPLDAIIERCGQLPIGYAVEAVSQACTGVQAAHDAGIVHRDLKPENLFLIEQDDGLPFVKILDFGISKFDPLRTGDQSLTQDGAQLGTPYYMSPEQILAQPVDGRTDVYSLGVVLYECLAGCRPFEAETLPKLTILIHSGDCVPVESHRDDVPAALAKIVRCAMARDRHERYATPAEMVAALRGVTAEQSFERTLYVPRDSLPHALEPHPAASTSGSHPAVAGRSEPAPGTARGSTGTHVIAAQSTDRSSDDLGSTTQAGALSSNKPAIGAAAEPRRSSGARYVVAGAIGGAVLIVGGIAIGISMSGGGGAAPAAAKVEAPDEPSASAATRGVAAPKATETAATPEPDAEPEPTAAATAKPREATSNAPAVKPKAALQPEVTPAVTPEPLEPKPTAEAKPEPEPTPPPPKPAPPPPTKAQQDGLKGNPFAK